MPSTERSCPNCRTPLPASAAFCYACGTATPAGIDRQTGEFVVPETTGMTMNEILPRLRTMLGPSYELGSLIGSGGFAEVFKARDLRLKRDLAVKVTRPDFALNPQMMARFRREAETIAALRHPHIMPIYDIGEAEGIAYLVMPFIHGESLRTRLDREPKLPVEQARQILLQAGEALAAAHEAGVVHRDIKPDNIMLDRREDQVLLMDFGIAKAIEGGEVTALTSTGLIMGTPHYMSPEQAAGERGVDARSDQYSLAVIAYRMLSGALPFDGPSVRSILAKQLIGAATPLREVAPDTPPVLLETIERAMRKEPDERFPSVRAFITAVRADPTYVQEMLRHTGGVPPYVPEKSQPAIAPPAPAPTSSRARGLVALGATLAVVGGAGYALLRGGGGGAPTTPAASEAGAPATPTGSVSGGTVALPPSTDSASTASQSIAPSGAGAATASTTTPAAPVSDTTAARLKRDSGAVRLAGYTYGTPPADSYLVYLGRARNNGCQKAFDAGRQAEAAKVCGAVARSSRPEKPAAQRTLGILAERAGHPDSAFAWYERAWSHDPEAALRMSVLLDQGQGVTADPGRATTIIQTTAENGSVLAQRALAERFQRGAAGAPKDDATAATWFTKAANNGDVPSMVALAAVYRRGRPGVKQSDVDAVKWELLAAQKGDRDAQYELGMAYIRGRGVEKSKPMGLEWLRKAAAQGHEGATKEIERNSK